MGISLCGDLATRPEEAEAVHAVLNSGRYIGGDEVAAFEREFAAATGAAECVGVGSGTAALTLALRAIGIGRGDVVIVPALTFVATAAAVHAVGARPLFVDVGSDGLIDPHRIADEVWAEAHAVIPVYLWGGVPDMDGIRLKALRWRVAVLEDCAQAAGASLPPSRHTRAWSFFPAKPLGGIGDGGAITTTEAGVAARARIAANHGRAGGKHDHLAVGVNSRLDAVNAAVLRIRLRRLAETSAARRRIAYRYSGLGLAPVQDGQQPFGAWAHYVIDAGKERAALRSHLRDQGIETGIHYPYTLPELLPFVRGGVSSPCLAARGLARTVLSLPIHPQMSEGDVDHVVECYRRSPAARLQNWPDGREVPA